MLQAPLSFGPAPQQLGLGPTAPVEWVFAPQGRRVSRGLAQHYRKRTVTMLQTYK
jgi:hypothetical protein